MLNLFGVHHPIIQAPMAGVSTPKLAAAVSNAGGLGSISIGASTQEQARQLIEETKQLTSHPFNVNVFCHPTPSHDVVREAAWLAALAPFFAECHTTVPTELKTPYRSFRDDEQILALLLALKPPIVSFHFGLPSRESLSALQAAGIKTMATATNVDEAKRIEAAGNDAIVAQGIEAGGHRGQFAVNQHDTALSTAVLVSLLIKQSQIPVIAAGGIMDGQGIKAALALGAIGVQMGTAFILCPESAANATYRAALKSEQAYDTQLTSLISGRPARGLVNRLMLAHHLENLAIPAYPIAYDAAKSLHAAASVQGNHDFAVHWAGQGAPLARELPAAQLITKLLQECN
ncbi:nitronate monooxygenase [Candidatus Berkiella aquae]|uniref:Nitronate monooxygenase n=1 Tax=Candidatus Berkiella aquae TaxID=295108 RepID=A0A0Q9YWH3_9GAMM|nr:nitronate monooxygenase [Candidatus Berkiella aquae]MCS5712240.1 nitronate monooxygenase [Candidatus Berkiella aquae]